MGTNRWSLF